MTRVLEKLAQLTPKQRRAYDYLVQYIEEHGYSPMYAEIEAACGIADVSACLKRLERIGLIQRDRGRWRGVRLCLSGHTMIEEYRQLLREMLTHMERLLSQKHDARARSAAMRARALLRVAV